MRKDQTVRSILIKVPEITLYFWIIKVLSTTVGETFADYLNSTLGYGLSKTSEVMSVFLLIILGFQIKSKKYIPVFYWGAVVMMSITGTLLTDNLTDNFGVSLVLSSLIFLILLIGTFILWYRAEATLSIHSVDSVRRETFYWATILFTFALGTAAGDLAAEKMNLGYGLSLAVFAISIVLLTVAWRFNVVGDIGIFWLTYVLTRPLGASLGDFLSQEKKNGGLGIGTTNTSYIFLVAILGLVLFLTFTKRDVIKAPELDS